MIPPLRIEVIDHEADDRTVVRLTGEIDIATAPFLEVTLLELTGDIVVDLAEVSFMDSTGLGVLSRAQAKLEEEGVGTVSVVNPIRQIRKIFELTGLAETLLASE